MSSIHIVDLIILAVLAFFAWRGARKGLILSLFSLLALVVAFYGAKYVSTTFTSPVADILRPSIQLSINELLSGESPDSLSALPSSAGESTSDEAPSSDFTPEQILRLLDQSGAFPGLREYLETAIHEEALSITSSAAAAVARYLARVAASALLFGVSFLVILLLWGLAGRALDLTFRLPILSAVNAIGGLLFGLLKAVIVLAILVWVGQLLGLITAENSGTITSLMSLERLSAAMGQLILRAVSASA